MSRKQNKKHYKHKGRNWERECLFRQMFVEGLSYDDILVRVNAIPGSRSLSLYELSRWKRDLALRRPDWFIQQIRVHQYRKAQKGNGSTEVTPPKPPLPDIKLKPIRRLKDGGPDMARMLMLEHEKEGKEAPAKEQVALAWGHRWCHSKDINVINSKRQEFGLPKFKIFS